jgi:hypothetical protein
MYVKISVIGLLIVLASSMRVNADCLECPENNQPCAHPDLSQTVEVPAGNWYLQVCYAIYGNDDPDQLRHDGVEAWVQTNLNNGDSGIVADYALPPEAVGVPLGSTTVARCEDVPVSGPFSFSGEVMTEANSFAHWGCSSPKLNVPSELRVILQPAAQ